jgi:hypothetical protein
MMTMNRFSSRAVALLGSLVLAACASEPDSVSEAESDMTDAPTVKVDETTSFAGTFTVPVDGKAPTFAFSISKIDWAAGTAEWDARVTSADGMEATDDVSVAMTIARARCPGCFTFSTPRSSRKGTLAVVTFQSSRLTELVYSDLAADAKITSATSGDGANGGSCSVMCNGGTFACTGVAREAECTADAFQALPRCPYTVVFAAGEACSE